MVKCSYNILAFGSVFYLGQPKNFCNGLHYICDYSLRGNFSIIFLCGWWEKNKCYILKLKNTWGEKVENAGNFALVGLWLHDHDFCLILCEVKQRCGSRGPLGSNFQGTQNILLFHAPVSSNFLTDQCMPGLIPTLALKNEAAKVSGL